MKLTYKLPIILMTLCLSSSFAASLKDGKKHFRIGTTISQAEALWVGDKETDFDNNGERVANTLDASFAWGTGNGWQNEIKTSYMKTEMTKGSAGGRTSGDKEQGLAELSYIAQKDIKIDSDRFKMSAHFGFGIPGDDTSEYAEENFLAVSDGATKIYLGSKQSYHFSRQMSLNLDLTYIHKIESDKPDQLITSLTLPVHFKGWGLSARFDYFHSFGGFDIGSPEFGAFAMRTGAPPFSQKDEKFTSASLAAYYIINPSYVLDAFYLTKLDGENSDVGANIGLGLNTFF